MFDEDVYRAEIAAKLAANQEISQEVRKKLEVLDSLIADQQVNIDCTLEALKNEEEIKTFYENKKKQLLALISPTQGIPEVSIPLAIPQIIQLKPADKGESGKVKKAEAQVEKPFPQITVGADHNINSQETRLYTNVILTPEHVWNFLTWLSELIHQQ